MSYQLQLVETESGDLLGAIMYLTHPNPVGRCVFHVRKVGRDVS